MSWRDELNSDDDLARILAIGQAGRKGGPELIDAMLDVALHDSTEVQTTGGMAEVWEKCGDAAAEALKGILERHGGGVDERVRAAAFDVDNDDQRVGVLLHRLGARYEPVRRELETSADERLRIRALKAVPPFDRSPELSERFLADPSPAVRAEALAGSARLPRAALEAALTDPVAGVRLAAAKKLQLITDSEAVVEAARVEIDPKVRDVLAKSLVGYRMTDRVRSTLRGYLVNDVGAIDTRVAAHLQQAGDVGVSAAIAARGLIDIQEQQLLWIVQNALLRQHVPEVRALVEYLHRHAPVNYLRYATGRALEAGTPSNPYLPPPADGLDAVQQARLILEVLRWAEAALGAEASSGLKVWTAAPDDHTAAQWITEHDWFGDGVQGELLRAAVDGDLPRVLAVELRPGREADLLRLAHRFTAAQIRAGLNPITPGPLNPLLLLGPDALRVQAVALRLRQPAPLFLAFRPKEPAALFVSCPGCGEPVQVTGEVACLYRDDDRISEFDTGYSGILSGDCPACGAAARAEVRLTETTQRFALTREISWDGVW